MNDYSEAVQHLFADPSHAGALAGGVAVAVDEQEVRLGLSAAANDGTIIALRFQVWGCPHTIATAEAACAALEGGPATALLEFSAADLMEELAVPVEKTGRILVLEDGFRALGRALAAAS